MLDRGACMSDNNYVIPVKDWCMMMAELTSYRSSDPNTQVGAVIVSQDNRILSVGYNGWVNGSHDTDFPWNRLGDERYDTKYPYVCHAEMNAIVNFCGNRDMLKNSIIYVTLFPCSECTKLIVQSGISTVYYESDKYSGSSDNRSAKRIMDTVGIRYCQHLPSLTSRTNSIVIPEENENRFVTTLNLKNKYGCIRSGIQYCSRCDAPINIRQTSRNIDYCYSCGAKFNKTNG